MKLLDRYLHAVRFFLPRNQQDDIVRELSENLISQFEDREAELGRPLNEDEQADILRGHGHPMWVAGTYRSQKHLIGPALFSIYLVVLKLGLAIAALVSVLLAFANILVHGQAIRHLGEAVVAYPSLALTVFAITTLVFAALDLAQTRLRLKAKWDPRRLPDIFRPEERSSRLKSAGELIFTGAAVVWLLLIPQNPALVLGPFASFVDLAPIWSMVYLPILALCVLTGVLAALNFVRPRLTRSRSISRIALHAATFFLYATLFRAGEWVTAKADVVLANGAPLEPIVTVVNLNAEIIILIACGIKLFEFVRELLRWKASRKSTSASESATAPLPR